jgi:hypothetical protein
LYLIDIDFCCEATTPKRGIHCGSFQFQFIAFFNTVIYDNKGAGIK